MTQKVEVARMEAEIAFKEKEIVLAYLFWFFLGPLGVHRFYLGRIKTGVAFLLMSTIGAFLLFPLFIVGIWWLVDAYLVYKYVEEHNDEMKRKKLEHVSGNDEDQILDN